jgi:hypothetical protein
MNKAFGSCPENIFLAPIGYINIVKRFFQISIKLKITVFHLERVEVAASAGAAIGDNVSLLMDVESVVLVGL